MFQSFESIATPQVGPARIKLLRAQLKKDKLDGFLVPRADEHQGEYVPPSAERLRWLTGFSGSAGLAIVLLRDAAVFVDGRYIIQVASEVDVATFDIQKIPSQSPSGWLCDRLSGGGRIGFDPWLHTPGEIARLTKALSGTKIVLVQCRKNLVDAIWSDRPAPPAGPVSLQPEKLAGEAAKDKIIRIQHSIAENGAHAAVLSAPDSIAWLLNIRGSDVAHTPVALAFAIVPRRGKPELYIASAKLDNEVRAYLKAICTVHDPAALPETIAQLGAKKRIVQLDPETSAIWFKTKLEATGAKVLAANDPCILPKSRKNGDELAGMRQAHLRDGVAMVRFLCWLDQEAASGKVDEISAAAALESFRAQTGELREISFDTISGAGPNGAIVHYRVNKKTNRKLKPGELYLVDSGAQYRDGTTDITRTIAIGHVANEEARRNFTRVLKGHIAIALARFPAGTRGVDLDPFARQALWQAGLDFDHGTGHGVGSFLSVHEGPASISRRSMVPLEEGMVLSNEPGFYKTGAYGIRIENLVIVKGAENIPGGDRPMMEFETITLAPIDRRLVVPEMLSDAERDWLNAYHARVRAVLSNAEPGLSSAEKKWLRGATRRMPKRSQVTPAKHASPPHRQRRSTRRPATATGTRRPL